MPLDNSAESPLPVRTVARSIAEWVGRLGRVWVEGQVAQLTPRPGTVFLTLRDPVADVSLSVTCSRGVFESVVPALSEGARIVVHGQPVVHLLRGSLQLQALDIRPVGVGELLARLERLKGVLRAEGLFDTDRKKRLPFLPRTIGLVTGRGSAAEHDVLENARRRWPAVRFDVRSVAVQGHLAVEQCIAAIAALDREPEVEVIVLARGGGSVEDLLPFSDEALCRAVAACRTPVVSAIGHEPDNPLVDAVADVRCSTPTDAGKRVVPDYAEEVARVRQLRDRARRVATGVVQRELARLDAMRSRPALADPQTLVTSRAGDVAGLRDRSRRCVAAALDRAAHDLDHTRARVLALSPKATLDRGYAVVHDATGAVVRDPADVSSGDPLRIRVSAGELEATVR
ncbi:MAG: exodeoxyribonuclease large subunit [Actinomycetota bacterium]|jgi:exodeoxyribonuclease VII large subunit|nr:exodeoxyribonuclease large subunit [Actinomycetota bacterium]